jgi:RNA polymerase sigma factor (sigma-70 family)
VSNAPIDRSQIETLGGIAYRVAFRILGQREDAEDVAQEAVTRAAARWTKVADYAEAWVSRVAANLALGLVRKRRRAERQVEQHAPEHESLALERLMLGQALLALPRRQREVVVLRYVADLSEKRVAELLGCSTGSVKRHSHRGLIALRARLSLPNTEAAAPAPFTNGVPDVRPS